MNKIYKDLKERKKSLAVIGLGYVGMPIAIEFARRGIKVVGFDINEKKIEMYKNGIDPTNEIGNKGVAKSDVTFTSNPQLLNESNFFIVAVPTPINIDKTPNLDPVLSATEIVAKYMPKKSIVMYESTVYPGVTEDICAPLLEEKSGYKYKKDFYVGYSPERINPGDKVHTLTNIKKIVSGDSKLTLEVASKVYEIVIDGGIHRAKNIKVAEAAKVAENSQRDINIAFMNELSMVFNRMNIDTKSVIEAMNTKWNSLGFYPGLVGGHCIGVDPYYFIYQAERLGYHSQIILSGRKINDGMSNFVVKNIVKQLILANKKVKGSKVGIFGLTFKENCPDIRNSKVIDIINGLKEYGVNVIITDPYVDENQVNELYSIKLTNIQKIKNLDCIVLAVKHREYMNYSFTDLNKFYNNSEKVLIDIKSIFNEEEAILNEYSYWRL